MSYDPRNDARVTIPLTLLDPGFFLHIKIFPCSVNPFIAGELLIPAAMKAFIGFEGPDPKHIFHKAAGFSLLKDIRLEFAEAEILEPEVGDILDKITRMVWKFDAAIDEGIWWLFVASIIGEFFIDWGTSVYRVNGCLDYGASGWVRSGDNECVYSSNQGYEPAALWLNCSDSNGDTTTASAVTTWSPGLIHSLQWTSEWIDVSDNPIPTKMRIQDTTNDKTLDEGLAFGSLFSNTTWSMTAVYDSPPTALDRTIVLQATNDGVTSVNEVFGKSGGYFSEYYTIPPSPINVDWSGPWLPGGLGAGPAF